ncbi:MAG: DNA polymerase III subunit chi [Lysobacterales bacterium]
MPHACQVDFYVMQDESLSTELLACRLALMAWQQGNRIMVVTENEESMDRLDALMWEHPQGRFLPHGKKSLGAAPVLIGQLEQLHDGDADVVINLTRTAVPAPQRFQRLLELVPASDEHREASRNKFREYRTLGLKPESHPMNRN